MKRVRQVPVHSRARLQAWGQTLHSPRASARRWERRLGMLEVDLRRKAADQFPASCPRQRQRIRLQPRRRRRLQMRRILAKKGRPRSVQPRQAQPTRPRAGRDRAKCCLAWAARLRAGSLWRSTSHRPNLRIRIPRPTAAEMVSAAIRKTSETAAASAIYMSDGYTRTRSRACRHGISVITTGPLRHVLQPQEI